MIVFTPVKKQSIAVHMTRAVIATFQVLVCTTEVNRGRHTRTPDKKFITGTRGYIGSISHGKWERREVRKGTPLKTQNDESCDSIGYINLGSEVETRRPLLSAQHYRKVFVSGLSTGMKSSGKYVFISFILSCARIS